MTENSLIRKFCNLSNPGDLQLRACFNDFSYTHRARNLSVGQVLGVMVFVLLFDPVCSITVGDCIFQRIPCQKYSIYWLVVALEHQLSGHLSDDKNLSVSSSNSSCCW